MSDADGIADYLEQREADKARWRHEKKRRRCFHRVMSGLQRGGQIRFLTLTSGPDSPPTCQRAWRALTLRLRRRGLMLGYIRVPERTKAGKQHLHILLRGSYLDQVIIAHWWQELHHAQIIDIRLVRYSHSHQQVASYVAKYMSKESAGNYSWDWGWVWRGFCNHWRQFKKNVSHLQSRGFEIPFARVLHWWSIALARGQPDILWLVAPNPEEST